MHKIHIRLSFILVLMFFPYQQAKAQDWETDYNKAWQALSEKDSASAYMEKAKTIAIAHDSVEGMIQSGYGLMYISGYHYDLSALRKQLTQFSDDLNKVTDFELSSYGRSIFLLENVNYNYKINNYNIAQKYADSLLTFIDSSKAKSIIENRFEVYDSAMQYKASIYKKQGQFEQAKETYRRLLIFLEKEVKDEKALLEKQISVYRLLAQTHADAGDILKAVALEERLLKDDAVSQKRLNSNAGKVLILSYISHLVDLKKYTVAQKTLTKVDDLGMLNTKFLLLDLENRARIYQGTGNQKMALKFIDKAITTCIDYRKSKHHNDVIKFQLMKARFLLENNNHKTSSQLSAKVFELLINKPIDFSTARLRLEVLQLILSSNSKEIMSLDKVDAYSVQLINAIDFLQPQFISAIDKQKLIEEAFSTIQLAFDFNAYHYLKHANETAFKNAFKLSEKYRSIDLRQITSYDLNTNFSKIEKELVDTEKRYSAQIIHIQNASLKNPNLKDSLFVLNNMYASIKNQIKEAVPNYYDFKFGNTVVTLKKTQDFLEDNQSLISYFFTNKALYAITLTKKKKQLQKIDWDITDEKLLSQVIEGLRNPNSKNEIGLLSQKLVTPILSCLNYRTTIIPDGLLHQLPFEILSNGNQEILYKTAISYDESISIAVNKKPSLVSSTSVKAFAPFTFNKNTTQDIKGYLSLNGARKEFTFVSKELPFQLFLGGEASIARFRKSVTHTSLEELQIVHVASHAVANQDNTGFIAFNDNSHTNRLLAEDIYSLQMNNSFVILSACETGLGDVVKGQGMKSLSQAFRYAGSNALLHSKWKVSDRATAFLMNAFYKELASGKTKDIALQQAKINYINQAPDNYSKHPFYWASFVVSGDLEAIPLEGNNYWLLGLLSLLILLSVFIWIRKTNLISLLFNKF